MNLDLYLRVLDCTSSVEELLAMLDCLEDGVFLIAPDQDPQRLFTWLFPGLKGGSYKKKFVCL